MYENLQVIQSRGLLPIAHVTNGSVVVHVSLGITRWHALGRASRWARAHASRFVYVQKWADDYPHRPVDKPRVRTAQNEADV
jgi:hypothetical protein